MKSSGNVVMMPVRCIGVICGRCNKLKLEINRYYMRKDVVTTDIYCTNVQTCELIKQMVENETKKEGKES